MTDRELRRFLAAVSGKHSEAAIRATALELADVLTQDMGSEAREARKQLFGILMRGALNE